MVGLRTRSTGDRALERGGGAITASPMPIPATGPARIAADTTALVAHSVVGHDWLASVQWGDATSTVVRHQRDDQRGLGEHPGPAPAEPLQVGRPRTPAVPRGQDAEEHPAEHRAIQLGVLRTPGSDSA